MKRINRLLITLIFLITFINQNKIKTQDAELEQNFNTALLNKANELEDRFNQDFEDAALLIRDYKFEIETQPIDTIYQNFNDFINDTATNYFVAMYNKIHNETTGLPYVKNDACPPADPLAASLGLATPCSITAKDEYALEQTSDTLIAIAYEYSRKLKQLGSEIIEETGLLDKVIEMTTQQLTFANLPSMVVQDSIWINQFKKQEISTWDTLWNGTKELALAAGEQFLTGLKNELYDLAGEQLDTWLESAKSATGPLMQEITEYRSKLEEAEKTILEPLEEISTTIDDKLSEIKDTTRQATLSFVSYLDSAMESFSTDLFTQPILNATQSILDKIIQIDTIPVIKNVSDNLKTTTQNTLTQITTAVSNALVRLQGEIDNAKNTLINPLTQLNRTIESSQGWLTSFDLSDKAPEEIKTEVTKQINDITSSLSTVASAITSDITDLTNDFIQPISNALTQLDGSLKRVENNNIFEQAPAELPSTIQLSIKETADTLESAASGLAKGIEDLSIQLKDAFNAESQDIQTVITQSTNMLTDTASELKDNITNYLNDKIKIISDAVELIDNIITQIEDVSGRDFLDLAESFILSPTKALKELENLTTCKTIDDQGRCSKTYMEYLNEELKITKVPSELAEFYKEITSELNTTFETFTTNLEEFVASQEERMTSVYDETINTTLASGQTTKDTLTTIPNTLKKLIQTIKDQSLQQVESTLNELNDIKNSLTTITTNFNQMPKIDDVISMTMKNKDNAQNIITSLPNKIETLTTLLKNQAEGKTDELIAQLDTLKQTAASYAQILSQEISAESILQELQTPLSSIDKLITDITDGAFESVSSIVDGLRSLEDITTTLSGFITNGKDTLQKQTFEKIKSIITELDFNELDTLNKAKNLADYTSTIQETINSIINNIEDAQNAATQLIQEGGNFVTSFDSEETAQKVQIQIQAQLDPAVLKLVSLVRDGATIRIEPNFVSVATEKFYELIDDAIKLITDKLSKVFQTFS